MKRLGLVVDFLCFSKAFGVGHALAVRVALPVLGHEFGALLGVKGADHG